MVSGNAAGASSVRAWWITVPGIATLLLCSSASWPASGGGRRA